MGHRSRSFRFTVALLPVTLLAATTFFASALAGAETATHTDRMHVASNAVLAGMQPRGGLSVVALLLICTAGYLPAVFMLFRNKRQPSLPRD